MGTVGWLLVVAIGIALGFGVGRLWPGSAARLTELERERDAAREDLKNYRQEVGAHFEATAGLFDKVTADYRSLYEHLATGARQLGAIRGEPVELPLAEPERRRLAQSLSADSAAAPSATATPGMPPSEAAAPEAPQSELGTPTVDLPGEAPAAPASPEEEPPARLRFVDKDDPAAQDPDEGADESVTADEPQEPLLEETDRKAASG